MRMVKNLGAKGAALAEYVVLMAIVGGLAIFAIMDLGADVQQVYGEVDNTVATEIQDATGVSLGGNPGGTVPSGPVHLSMNRTEQMFCKQDWMFYPDIPPVPVGGGVFRDWGVGGDYVTWTAQVVSGDLGALGYYDLNGLYRTWDHPDGAPESTESAYPFYYYGSEENPGWHSSPGYPDCTAVPSPFQIRFTGVHQDGSTAEIFITLVPTVE